jgi:hypothetical protein
MRRLLFCLLAITLTASILYAHDPDRKHRRGHWGHGLSISTNNDVNSDACADHIDVYDSDHPAIARGEEVKMLPNQPLRVTAARNGGIHVRTWDKNEISVKVCKVATGATDATAQAALNKITMTVQGGSVSVDSPDRDSFRDDGAWSALLLIHAPAGAQLDLSAHNGGISLYRVNGNVTANTVNGGIKLKESKGKLDISARNGGISVKDCGGDVRVEVQNGGVNIELADTWTGTGLDAHTRNGGLKVSVPAQFKSSLEVESRGHGSMRCRGDICAVAERTWDDRNKYFRIGKATTPVIRASTVNGGVVISDRSSRDADYDD